MAVKTGEHAYQPVSSWTLTSYTTAQLRDQIYSNQRNQNYLQWTHNTEQLSNSPAKPSSYEPAGLLPFQKN